MGQTASDHCINIQRSKHQQLGLRPILDQVGKRQRLTRSDEARLHLRDRPGDDSDRAALEASLRFSRGLGAKSSCKVKKILSEDEELLLENSIRLHSWFRRQCQWHKTEYLGGYSCVQFPPRRHNWQHHNFGFWVMGSPAVRVVGLPPYPKHQYDRKYLIIQLWVLDFGSAAVETL
jgi:hypothetical protein